MKLGNTANSQIFARADYWLKTFTGVQAFYKRFSIKNAMSITFKF
jgi:hypothetical protein